MFQRIACSVLVATFVAAPVWAQFGAPIFLAAQYEHSFIDSELPQWTDWQEYHLQGYLDLEGGAIGAALTHTERFRLEDRSVTVDAYVDLWEGAYSNVRARAVPGADVLPRWDARLELFQVFANVWEGSFTGWHMDVATGDVEIVGAALARYTGNWYLRGRVFLSRNVGESAGAVALSARRFFGGSREFLDVSAGTGEEVVILGAGPVVDLRRTDFVQVVGQRFLTARLGLSGRAGYTTFEEAPSRLALSVGLLVRLGATP